MMKRSSIIAGIGGCLTALTSSAAVAQEVARPVVVEMFLSQSCRSSPPAADYMRTISSRSDIVALAWHVDYWNDVAAKKVGAWSDPYSSALFTQRQKMYNKRIRGRGTVFTPQAIVDGIISVVGSDDEAIEQRITEARFVDELARATPALVRIDHVDTASNDERARYRAEVSNVGAAYDAFFVSFRPSTKTDISGGDNAGVELEEVNVVTGVKVIASRADSNNIFEFDGPDRGQGCAVLVQERGLGRVVAAQYCPSFDIIDLAAPSLLSPADEHP